jgi:hypothetical protein
MPALANRVQPYLAGAEWTNVRLRHPYWAVCDFRGPPDDAKIQKYAAAKILDDIWNNPNS